MNELSDKQVYMYKQKYLSHGSHNPPKVWNGEGGGGEWRALKNNFIDRKNFIRQYQRNGWMDLSELRDIDSLHIESTDTLLRGGLGWKGWCIEA